MTGHDRSYLKAQETRKSLFGLDWEGCLFSARERARKTRQPQYISLVAGDYLHTAVRPRGAGAHTFRAQVDPDGFALTDTGKVFEPEEASFD